MRKFFWMMSGVSIISTIVYGAWMFLAGPQQSSALSLPGMNEPNAVRYVAIGDSYTVGEGVASRDAWPSQIVKLAKQSGITLSLVSTVARSGWNTQDLIEQGLPAYDSTNAQFVTLMIGTNDAEQGNSPSHFQTNLRIILDKIEQQVPPEKVVVVTIPDYILTPTGAQKAKGDNPEQEIRDLNSIIQDECAQRGCVVADIFDTSRLMGTNATLVGRDKLHPSASGHLVWADAILPAVLQVFGK